MVTFDEAFIEINEHITEFQRLYKCLKKKVQPKEDTKQKNLTELIFHYNKVCELINTYYTLANKDNKIILNKTFSKLRDKVVILFSFFQLNIHIPPQFSHPLDPNILNSNSPSDIDSDDDPVFEMAENARTNFIATYSKLIPEFDGIPENLTRFIDALELVNDNVGDYMDTAIRIIKTKLIGSARSYITNETTIIEIVNTLKAHIKRDPSKVVIAKIMGLKQGNKTAVDYINEIEKLATALKRAYLSEGIPATVADSYSTDHAVNSIISNTSNEKIKTVMQAGDFKTLNDAATKFVTASTENAAQKQQIFYNKAFNRGKGRGNYRGNFGHNHNQPGRGGHRGRNNNHYRGQRQYHSRGGRGGSYQTVRYTENSNLPQITLGGEPETSTH